MTSLQLQIETVMLGGLPIARLSRAETANLMIDLATRYRRGDRPWISAHANGQTLAEAAFSPELKRDVLAADFISCDGQSLVHASRFVTSAPLPERNCVTDTFHDVAVLAAERPVTMFLLGATEAENAGAVENARKLYPHLNIVGRLHGYRSEAEWDEVITEINRIGPDILWVALGLPRENQFYVRHATRLESVGLIKVCGGLFSYLSGHAPRAPQWMQSAGLEWVFRLWNEPRRLSWRYLTTNPVAAYLLLTHSARAIATHRLTVR